MRNSRNSRNSPRWRRGWLAACLLLCLTGCAGGPRLTSVTKTEKQFPPASLTVQTAEPLLLGSTNGNLLSWGLDLRDALSSCNADKKAIETWAAAKPAP